MGLSGDDTRPRRAFSHTAKPDRSASNFLEPRSDWETWFRAMGIEFAPTQGPRFSQADHAIDAALAGVGMVLGRRALVVKDLADGRLVTPFKTALDTGVRFRFLCAEGAETRPQIAAFRDWIVAEIAKTEHITNAMTLLPAADYQRP